MKIYSLARAEAFCTAAAWSYDPVAATECINTPNIESLTCIKGSLTQRGNHI
jgi:hypothetical protein